MARGFYLPSNHVRLREMYSCLRNLGYVSIDGVSPPDLDVGFMELARPGEDSPSICLESRPAFNGNGNSEMVVHVTNLSTDYDSFCSCAKALVLAATNSREAA